MIRAFTLIEIIFVIAVILIIAALGAGSYGAARRSMAVDLEADTLVASLHQFRDASRVQPKCAGVRFTKNTSPKKIETAYLNSKQGCDANETLSELVWPDEVIISKLVLGDAEQNSLSILFIPPHGTMKIVPANEKTEVSIAFKANTTHSRTVVLEPKTGKIEKL
jgi:prepilin-type N-terminal cleavage/methylation domain-containing protein